MGTRRNLRKHAPLLLDASKSALRFLLSIDNGTFDGAEEKERLAVMSTLREAIDTADPPDEDFSVAEIRLEMTPATWLVLERILVDMQSVHEDYKLTLASMREGLHETKRRIYVTLPINPLVLRRLKFVLDHKAPKGSTNQDAAFKRLAKQVQTEGIEKNPMEILAEMGF